MGHASGTPTARSSLHTSSRGENSIRVNSPPHSTQEIIPKDAPANVSDPPASQAPKPFKPDGRFWFILVSIAVMTFCGTVESTIIINALPTIVADLGGGPAYIWVPNAFFLASVAVLPLYAQMSNIFGRRHLLLIAVALFILGSGLCGGSSSMGMLIASRAIQVCLLVFVDCMFVVGFMLLIICRVWVAVVLTCWLRRLLWIWFR